MVIKDRTRKQLNGDTDMPIRRENEFSLFIDNALREQNISNNELARKTGIVDSYISRWRRGLILPSRRMLPLIAQGLGVSAKELGELWIAVKYGEQRDALQAVQDLKKLKMRLLLHFYEGDRFLGQTLPEIEVGNFDELQGAVIETYPGTKFNLQGIPTKNSGTNIVMALPSLKEGYGQNTFVKVMQVIPLF